VAIDLDPAVFPPGRAAQTMIHHIDVLVHRTAETTFELWVLRSFAESLAEWVLDAGQEFGAAFSASGPRTI
jgi:sarcosine oxidase subunit gamma